MKLRLLLSCLLFALCLRAGAADTALWSHVRSARDLGELRAVTVEWEAGAGGVLRMQAPTLERHAWAVIPPPPGGWDLQRRAAVEAQITNRSAAPLSVLLWVVGDRGWDAVPAAAKLAPGESQKFSCDLRSAFPDGTPKIDPRQVKQVQVMITGRVLKPIALEVRDLIATGDAPPWERPPGRIDVPPTEEGAPAAGRRVRFRLPGDERIYSVLHLPEDWRAGKKFPLIVEYPGNVFFVPQCYSTGLPDQCVIGYGMAKGRGAIWASLPFVDRGAGTIAENGWGQPDDTADYAVRMVEELCARWGADRANVVLTGFSRGALACGYIGLRDDRIAALWKGIHACQHYDGDGWNGAKMDGAIERAARFRGVSVFQTDNQPAAFQRVMEAMKVPVTWAQSGLGAHACTMFLDDRAPTQQLRAWFRDLVATP